MSDLNCNIRPALLSFKVRPGFLVLMILLLSGTISHAQKLEDWVRFGNEATEEGDHFEAAKYYGNAVELAPQRLDLKYLYAQSLRRSKRFEEARKYYKQVFEEDRRGDRFPDCIFWLAKMQNMMGDYRQAKRSWGTLKRLYMREKDTYFYKKAEQKKEACDWADEALENDTLPIRVKNPGYPINTGESEFAPFVIEDSVFYFSALRADKKTEEEVVKDEHYRVRTYRSEKNGVEWMEPEVLSPPLNHPEKHQGNLSFGPDRKEAYFSRCTEKKGKKKCNILRVEKKENGDWGEPEMLKNGINGEGFNSTHPMMARMGKKKVLFFSSNGPGTKGKMDIWYAERKKDGSFKEPVNAGDSINSIDDEVTPFYLYASGELYFSSNWHYGFGGFDLFKASRKKKGEFSEPKNLKHPVNSPLDDLYPYIDTTGKKGYLASNREGSREGWSNMCCNDIFSWPVRIDRMNRDSIRIETVEDLNKFLPVSLYFHNDRPDPRTRDTTTNKTYEESYRSYKSRVGKYIEEYTKGVPESRVDTATMRMERFFRDKVDQGIADLELFTDLLIKELEKGQDIQITVKGYASPLAETEYNVNLTKRRINSLVNYLLDYKNGEYRPYIKGTAENGGSLSFIKKPYGEYSAEKFVSDNLNDKKNSVYSVSAALERKIEIVRVKQARHDSTYPELRLKNEVHDFGVLSSNDTLVHRFKFRNTGKDTLRIDSIVPGVDQIRTTLGPRVLAPEEKGWIEATLSPKGLTGKQVLYIKIWTNGIVEKREISITFENKAEK